MVFVRVSLIYLFFSALYLKGLSRYPNSEVKLMAPIICSDRKLADLEYSSTGPLSEDPDGLQFIVSIIGQMYLECFESETCSDPAGEELDETGSCISPSVLTSTKVYRKLDRHLPICDICGMDATFVSDQRPTLHSCSEVGTVV